MNEQVKIYIEQFPIEVQERMLEIRRVILEEAPEAEERISYKMPAYFWHGILVYYAGYEKHIGFYPTGVGMEHFVGELGAYKTSKGAVQFQHKEEIPYDLIRRMVKDRMQDNQNLLLTKKEP